MRKIILNLAVSLDGFIEGPSGEYDWCFTDQDYGMSKFLNRIDTIFFGRKSYEILLSAEKNPYPGKKKYVFSRTRKSAAGGTEIISGFIEGRIKEIKNTEGKDIWLFGGAELISALLNAGLIDEMQLAVHPIILGGGKRLFGGLPGRIKLRTIDCIKYNSGLVQIFYECG